MSQLRSKPPTAARSELDAFVSGAETSDQPATPVTQAVELYPWQMPGVREDMLKVYNLRLPEPYLLKLKYIAQHTPNSMQQVCLEPVLKAIDQHIEVLTAQNSESAR